MSVKAMAWAWEQPIKAGQKLVLLALADHANDDGECWPGQRRIAEKCGLSRQTVNAAIKGLVLLGTIRSEQQDRDDGSKSSNKYYLSILQGCKPALHGLSSFDTPPRVSKPDNMNRHIEPSVEPTTTLKRVRATKSPAEKLTETLEDETFMATLKARFPAVDIDWERTKMARHVEDKPPKSNYKNFVANWIERVSQNGAANAKYRGGNTGTVATPGGYDYEWARAYARGEV